MNKKLTNEMFWRDLLCKYVAHVIDQEGTSILDPNDRHNSCVKFTSIELTALLLAETQAEEVLKSIEYPPQPASETI